MSDQPTAPSSGVRSCVSIPPPTPRSAAASPAVRHHTASAKRDAISFQSSAGGSGVNEFQSVDYATSPCPSLVGEPVADIVACMLAAADDDASGAVESRSTGGARAEFSIVWPPTLLVGGSAELVELRAAVSLDAAAAAEVVGAAATGRAAALAAAALGGAALDAAASECCSRLLALRDDLVVGDEGVEMISAGSLDGRAHARLRLHADHPGVTSCILAGERGIPTLASFNDAAPLMALPQAARDETHTLLWRMMHEALPPNHSILPYDPDAFRSPVDRLPPRLQAALSWAWSHHFRAFAHDFSHLLDCPPPSQINAATSKLYGSCLPVAAGDGCIDAMNLYNVVARYHSDLAQMVCFLRDNDMFACLATLLQTAVTRGLTAALAYIGSPSSLSAMTAALMASLPQSPPSPSAASESSYEPSIDVITASVAAPAAPQAVSNFQADGPRLCPAEDPAVSEAAAEATVAEATAAAVAAGVDAVTTVQLSPMPRRSLLQLLVSLLMWLLMLVFAVRLSYGGLAAAAASWSLVGICLPLPAFLKAVYGSIGGGVTNYVWRWRGGLAGEGASPENAGDGRRHLPSAEASDPEYGGANGGRCGAALLRARPFLLHMTGAVHVAVATWCGAATAALVASAAPPPTKADGAASAAAMAILLASAPLVGMPY